MPEKLTSLRVDSDNYCKFKELTIKHDITFHQFVNFCIEQYILDDDFRTNITSDILHTAHTTNHILCGTPSRKPKKQKEVDKSFLESEFKLTKSDGVRSETREF